METGLTSFYQTSNDYTNAHGTLGGTFDCCTPDIATNTKCPGLVQSASSAVIGGKIFVYLATGGLTTPSAGATTLLWNSDFILAS